jgi:tRNA(Ile)-lysidine synthase
VSQLHHTVREIRARVAAMGEPPWLLAVSGGPDSMVLLDAAAAVHPRTALAVATFDHGTGAHASDAAAVVARRAAELRLPVVVGTAPPSQRSSEADWRAARWRFLAETAGRVGARVVTGHTRDDQVETVFMRALRGAGPRGLAALYARSAVQRPLLETSRAEILSYARSTGITFVTDPSNADRRHLRNRVRLDILPAILATRPMFGDELLAIARSAAEWRARIEAVALTFPLMIEPSGSHSFARSPFAGHSAAALRVLWPALAARAGVVMDWRGTERLASFTIDGETGQSIQLAGGVEVRMERDALVFAPLASRPRRRARRSEGARAE